MPRAAPPTPPAPRPASPVGPASSAEPRQRLLEAALALFAEHGFAGTSTRAIAQAAGTNIAAIRYYFGDKQGLYRAAFVEPLGKPQDGIARFADPSLSLRAALAGFFTTFIDPMRRGEVLEHSMRLHLREMVDRSELWQREIEEGIALSHQALAQVLMRHLGLRRADDELHRLAFAITALGVQTILGKDLCLAIRPRLLAGPAALDTAVQRLTDYALALVRSDAARRRAPASSRKTP